MNCGGDRMVPECNYCFVNNDTAIHAWCAGNCKYDKTEGTCTEIKGNIENIIFRFTAFKKFSIALEIYLKFYFR